MITNISPLSLSNKNSGEWGCNTSSLDRVSSFPANFETCLEPADETKLQERTELGLISSSLSCHRSVEVSAEEVLAIGDEIVDVNSLRLSRKSKSESNASDCINKQGPTLSQSLSFHPPSASIASSKSPPHTEPKHQSSCSILGIDTTAHRSVSPFTMIGSTLPWFSNADQAVGSSTIVFDNITDGLDIVEPNDNQDIKSNKGNIDNDSNVKMEGAPGDDSSVNSTAYFDPLDFDTSNWIQASMTVPTVGLALLALSAAITHPILFVVGALTAYGTATAAVKGYDIYFRNEGSHDQTQDSVPLWHLLCSEKYFGNFCDKYSPLDRDKEGRDFNNKPESPLFHQHNQNQLNNNNICFSNNEVLLKAQNPADDHSEVSEARPIGDEEREALQPADVLTTKQKKNTVLGRRIIDTLPEDWIDRYYPPLLVTIVQDSVFAGLNALEFFRVFFDDDAPYNFQIFQQKRGDININYGDWHHLTEFKDPISFTPYPANVPSTTTNTCLHQNFPTGLEYHSFQGRIITFQARTNSFIGPPWATTRKTQRIMIVSKRLAILESRTDLSDIPFSDKFFVVDRWVITAQKEVDRYNTRVTCKCEVFFTGNCPFESQIRSKSTSTIRDIVTSWVHMATQALKLTEKSKIERLSNSNADSTEDDDDDNDNLDKNTKTTSVVHPQTKTNISKKNKCSSNDAIEVLQESPHRVSINDELDCLIFNGLHYQENEFQDSSLLVRNSKIAPSVVDSFSDSLSPLRTSVWSNFRRMVVRPSTRRKKDRDSTDLS